MEAFGAIEDLRASVGAALRALMAELSAGAWFWQLLLLALIAGSTYFLARRIVRRHEMGAPGKPTVLETFLMPLIASGLILVTHVVAVLLGFRTNLLWLALLLAIAFLAARVTVHLVFRLLPSAAWLRVAEVFLARLVWLVVVLYFVDGLQPLLTAFDGIAVRIGGNRISLLDGLRVVLVLILFLGGAALLGVAIEKRLLAISTMSIGLRVGTAKVTRVVLIVLATLVAFDAVGVDLTALTVLGGAVGVGLGFGLQRIASNFISGFILLSDRSIRQGDVITVGQRFGVVQELRARYIVVRDRDGVDTLIPNENIMTSEVVNWSYSDRKIRLRLEVQISYHDDPRKAMSLMEEAAKLHPRVEVDPAPVVRLMKFADSGIDLELRYWIQDPEDGVNNIRSDLFLAIWDAFKEAGVTIPYPQRDVHLYTVPPST